MQSTVLFIWPNEMLSRLHWLDGQNLHWLYLRHSMLTWTPFCRHLNLAVSVCELNPTLGIVQGAQLCWQHLDISHLLRALGVSCPTSSSCPKREGACRPVSFPARLARLPQIPTASQKTSIHLHLGNWAVPCMFSRNRHITQECIAGHNAEICGWIFTACVYKCSDPKIKRCCWP